MDYRAIIQDGMDYIEENLKTQISAEEMASRAGFSLYHYYLLFRSATGMPVMQYILRRRLLHGIYEIRCGRTGIDVALDYGFDTYAGFYKAFRRELGCTPSDFLKHSRAKRPYRIDLTKEEHMFITRKKAAQILEAWGLNQAGLTDIYYEGTGDKNDNAYYVGEDYVLKFTANLGKLKNHMELSEAIDGIGLCAAVLIPTADGRPYVQEGECYFYLTKRLPGSQMISKELYEGDSAKEARFIGEIIGQLHLALSKIEPPVNDADLYATVRDWALPKSKEALGLTEGFSKAYIETLGTLFDKLPRQVIHRDPHPGNIIRSGDRWGFIDFELSERNVRIYDPCYAATAVLSETFRTGETEKWMTIYQNIVYGYHSVAKLTDEERQAIPYVILANQLVCVAWFAEQDKYADHFEVNKRMTRWLVDHFDELKLDV